MIDSIKQTNMDESSQKIATSKWLGKGPVWIMIFLIGPLAIPLLLRSPRFSKRGKWLISIILILFTVLVSVLYSFLMQYAVQEGLYP